MATPTVKTTYSLDVDTVRQLEQLAQRWKVSKSEALRRLIRSTSTEEPSHADSGLQALDQLQDSLGLSTADAERWEEELLNERLASSPPRASRPS